MRSSKTEFPTFSGVTMDHIFLFIEGSPTPPPPTPVNAPGSHPSLTIFPTTRIVRGRPYIKITGISFFFFNSGRQKPDYYDKCMGKTGKHKCNSRLSQILLHITHFLSTGIPASINRHCYKQFTNSHFTLMVTVITRV